MAPAMAFISNATNSVRNDIASKLFNGKMKRKYGEKVAESLRVYRETAIKTVFVALAVLLLFHFFDVAIVATIANLHGAEQAGDEIVRAKRSAGKAESDFVGRFESVERRTVRGEA